MRDRSIGRLLSDAAVHHASKPFVTFADETLTYAEADALAHRYANAFRSHGIAHGDKVGLLLPNALPILFSWFGLARIGAVEVPLNTSLKAPQVVAALEAADVTALICDSAYAGIVNAALQDLKGIDLVVVEGDPNAITVQSGVRLTDAVPSAQATPTDVLVSGRDLMAVLQTSGTSGVPKGVMVCHNHEYVLGRNIAQDMGLTADDVFYNFYPLSHNTAQGIITCAVLHVGAHMVLRDKFSGSRFWEDVQAHGCTAFYYMGSMLRLLLESEAGPADDDNTLRVSWGISANDEDLDAFAQRFDVRMCGGYGSTEANIPVYFPAQGRPAGSVGRIHPDFEVRIGDEVDNPVPPGVVGEILVRPKEPYTTMQGYINSPDATVEVWRNLWFHTGDAGYADADGNVYFTDRIKDVIRRRGETIPSAQVEGALMSFPGIEECAAVPVPAELGEDEVKAVLVGGGPDDLERVIAHCEELLPSYAVPRYFEWVEALPRTQTGKIRKAELVKNPFGDTTIDRFAR